MEKRSAGSWIVIALFLGSGLAHILNPALFLPLLPEQVPLREAIIVVSGVAEITAAIGLLLRLRFAPAYTTLVLLAIWPANWWFAFDQTAQGNVVEAVIAWVRIPLQLPLMYWAWKSPKRKKPIV